MIIMILGGLFALLFGRITVMRGWTLRGKYARLFGLTLLIAAFPISLVLASFLFFVAPQIAMANDIPGIVVNFLLTALILVALCYPFVLWQRSSVENPRETKANSTGKKIILAVGSVFLVLLALFLYSIYRGATGAVALMAARDSAEKQGTLFGQGKTADDCLREFIRTNPFLSGDSSGDDSQKLAANLGEVMNASVAADGFRSGCLQTSSDRDVFCSQIPSQYGSKEQKDWLAKECETFHIDAKKCDIAFGTLSIACMGVNRQVIQEKSKVVSVAQPSSTH